MFLVFSLMRGGEIRWADGFFEKAVFTTKACDISNNFF